MLLHHMYPFPLLPFVFCPVWLCKQQQLVSTDHSFLCCATPHRATGAVSIVLPPWVFHRKYLDTFTNELPQATRDEVDQMTNCDDLLFNFMMAAQSRRAPVVLDTRGIKRMHHLRKFARGEGLSKRDSHYTQRDQCLNDFAKAFGQMPLRYARTAVPIHSAPGQPVPAASAIDSADMHCVLCDSHEGLGDGEDCVRCEIK